MFSLAQKYSTKSFIVLGMVIFIIESNFYFSNLPSLNNPTNYSSFFKENSLIVEKPTNNNLFRYAFLNDQFQYNTSSMNISQFYGYETVPYPANFALERYPFGERMRVSNVKYIVTTEADLETKYVGLHKIKSIDPTVDRNEIFYSNTKDSTEINPGSTNSHYVYEVSSFLPRYFIPNEVRACPDKACLMSEDPSKISYVNEALFYLNNPLAKDVKVNITSYTPNTIKLLINSPKETFVASSEIFDEGWRIYINGKESRIINVNAGFKGFIVQRGRSEIRMSYSPPFIRAGLVFTLLGLVNLNIHNESKTFSFYSCSYEE